MDAYLRHISIERGLSEHTVAAYRRDLAGYVEWLARARHRRLGGGDAARRRASSCAEPASRASRRSRHPSRATAVVGARAAPLPRARGHRARTIRPRGCGRRSAAPAAEGAHDRPGRAAARCAGRAPATSRARDAARPRAARAAVRDRRARVGGRAARRRRRRRTATSCACAARGRRSGSCRSARTRAAALDAYLTRARPELSRRGRATPRLFLGARGAPLSRQSAWLVIQRRRRARAADRARVAAHPAALVRDPPAAGRRRRAGRAGAARPRVGGDDPDLHARLGGCAARRVRDVAPARALSRCRAPEAARRVLESSATTCESRGPSRMASASEAGDGG